jgi:hypothetical protein
MIHSNAFAALLTALSIAAPTFAQVAVGPVAHPTTGTRYYRLAPTTWANANTQAASLVGTLVTIHDAATNEWVRANIAAAGGNTVTCFIGINDVAAEGTFRWSNGEKPVYLNWLAGEPNNAGGGEDFGIMIPSSGLWNDIPDGINRPAIVEVTGPIRVPAEYATIQAAVDAAVDGQTILVARGQHTGNVNYGAKKLVIRSEGGPSSTTIRVLPGSIGINMTGGQGPETVFEGFTVVPSSGTADALVIAYDGQVIRNCRLNNPNAAGVHLRGTSFISDSLVVGCAPGVVVSSNGTRTNATVQNCTLVGNNQCLISIDNVPGISVTVSLINSVTAGNTSPFGAGGTANIFFFSNVVAEGDVGPNNLNADPLFVNAPGSNGIYELTDDYFLQPTSPCIDAANNARRKPLSYLSIPTDLRGGPRFVDDAATFDTGAGPGPVADCGAYEYTAPAPLCPVDFNADGFLDFFDYDAFVEAFEFGCAS